jgi:hypothetical protein
MNCIAELIMSDLSPNVLSAGGLATQPNGARTPHSEANVPAIMNKTLAIHLQLSLTLAVCASIKKRHPPKRISTPLMKNLLTLHGQKHAHR